MKHNDISVVCFAESFLSPAQVHSMPLPWPLVCGDTDQSPTRVGLSKLVSKVPVTFLTTTLIFFLFVPFFINLNTHNMVINTGSGKPKIHFCGRGYSLYLWSKRAIRRPSVKLYHYTGCWKLSFSYEVSRGENWVHFVQYVVGASWHRWYFDESVDKMKTNSSYLAMKVHLLCTRRFAPLESPVKQDPLPRWIFIFDTYKCFCRKEYFRNFIFTHWLEISMCVWNRQF